MQVTPAIRMSSCSATRRGGGCSSPIPVSSERRWKFERTAREGVDDRRCASGRVRVSDRADGFLRAIRPSAGPSPTVTLIGRLRPGVTLQAAWTKRTSRDGDCLRRRRMHLPLACSAIRGAGAQRRNGEGTSARASRVARGGRRCPDDRVRERGESSAGARHCQAARDGGAIRHRRRSRTNRPAGADRVPRAGDGRRRARRAARGRGRFARQAARDDRRAGHLRKDIRLDDSAARQRSSASI